MQQAFTRAVSLALLAVAPIAFSRRLRAEDRDQKPAVRIGEVDKVCQLTGETDWETNRPTAARTFSHFGLDAVDLGYPVEHLGKLIFLFGDSWPPPHGSGPLAEIIPDDSVGETARMALPDHESCLDLTVHSRNESGTKKFIPATVLPPGRVKQGFFNVPSGGVTVRGSLYAFFWTNHCSAPGNLEPSPDRPFALPAPTPACPQTDERNSLGVGVMAHSDDGGFTFRQSVPLPEGFVYTIAVNTTTQINLPEDQKLGVLIFGVPRYRASVPYLAYAPVEAIDSLAQWRFFAGRRGDDGKPIWVSRAAWKPGIGSQIYVPQIPAGNNVGEFSITWNVPLRMWIMMYGSVAVRVAHAPWGPWSAPTVILGPNDNLGCRLVMTPEGCGKRRDYWPQDHKNGKFRPGGLYAPFVINRYTRPGENPHQATLYFTLSTWNPYQVSIMRTTIEIPPSDDGPHKESPRAENEPPARGNE